ncbi:nucleotidyltransferase family protein [Desulfolutivibrio sp.]|uniref:nucleotidyltransferase family protein n=1 Tax=Desulfolutivibrio sp. TaxID=2773296 RepID=UPI002F96DC12
MYKQFCFEPMTGETTFMSKKITVRSGQSVTDALRVLDNTAAKLVVVLRDDDTIAGVISDGDIRRAYLRWHTLDLLVDQVMNPTPRVFPEDMPPQEILAAMRLHDIQQVPLVDEAGVYRSVVLLQDLIGWSTKSAPKTSDAIYDNPVVLMAGGLGERLRPLTQSCPKPLLCVGGHTILETIIAHFRYFNFHRFVISVNYLGHMIRERFGDGSRLGVDITYIEETKRLGTAGSLSLMHEHLTQPFFVMNADLLCNFNPQSMLEFHSDTASQICVGAFNHRYQVPYGVIEYEDDRIVQLVEKPKRSSFISAGIYLLSPSVLARVPSDDYLDMPTLINGFIAREEFPSIFPIIENWLDIGRPDDLSRAEAHYTSCFPHLLDEEFLTK